LKNRSIPRVLYQEFSQEKDTSFIMGESM